MFIGKHWRGQVPPLSAFLVGGVLTTLLLAACFRLLIAGLAIFTPFLRVASGIELSWYVIVLVIIIWAVVGMWRSLSGSALKYRLIGRSIILLGLVPVALQSPATFETARELGLIMIGRDPLGPPATMDFTSGTIRIDGLLSEGASARLTGLLRQHPDTKRLVLRSYGGRMLEAVAIADTARARGLDTHAREYCMSACTVVLVAGKRRSASLAAGIGFHQPTFAGYSDGDNRLMTQGMQQALSVAGVSAPFIEKALSVPASGMWFPSEAEMVEAGFLDAADRPAQLRELAASINATLPRPIDANLRFERASADAERITFLFRLLAPGRAYHLDRAAVAQAICADTFLAELIDADIMVTRRYVMRDGRLLGEVTQDQCPDPPPPHAPAPAAASGSRPGSPPSGPAA